jgi:hypothetical protein
MNVSIAEHACTDRLDERVRVQRPVLVKPFTASQWPRRLGFSDWLTMLTGIANVARRGAITEITRKLVSYGLFASTCSTVARGDDGPDGDLDFLVVVPDDHRRTNCVSAGTGSGTWDQVHRDIMPRKTISAATAWVASAGHRRAPGRLLYNNPGEAPGEAHEGAAADEDLASARILITSGLIANALFFCPAGRREKAPGASLMARTGVPATHDLEELGEACRAVSTLAA